jgi:excisionase family DNA binding protein
MIEPLTLVEVAARLDVSRPYAAMLCDAGLLGEVLTEGGHRRVQAPAVEAYLVAHAREHGGAPSPREAGVEADLYDHPDGHFKPRRA